MKIEKDIYNEFLDIFNKVYEKVDTSILLEKHLDIDFLYKRFFNVLTSIKTQKCVRGLDFGCGVGATSVLGKFIGIDVVGIDVPIIASGRKDECVNPYTYVQKELRKSGYNFIIRDTFKFPWNEFQDNEFDFLLSFSSLCEDYTRRNKNNHLDFDSPDMKKRLKELLRITTNESIWMVGGIGKYRRLKKSSFYKKYIKRSGRDIKVWNDIK